MLVHDLNKQCNVGVHDLNKQCNVGVHVMLVCMI